MDIREAFEGIIPNIYDYFLSIDLDNGCYNDTQFRFHYVLTDNKDIDFIEGINSIKKILEKKEYLGIIEVEDVQTTNNSVIIGFVAHSKVLDILGNSKHINQGNILMKVYKLIIELDTKFSKNKNNIDLKKIKLKKIKLNIKKINIFFKKVDKIIKLIKERGEDKVKNIEFELGEDDYMIGMNIILETTKSLYIPDKFKDYIDLEDLDIGEGEVIIFIKDFGIDCLDIDSLESQKSLEELFGILIRFLKQSKII